jgi:hypothetical protein
MLVQKGSRRKGIIGRAASAVGLDRMGEKLEENFGKFTATDVMFGDEASAIFGGEGGNQARTKTLGKVVGEKNVEKLDMVGDVATSIALAALPGGPAVMAGMQAVNQLANAAASDILTGDVNWGETLATTAISAGAGVAAAGAGAAARATYLGGAGAVNEFLRGSDWERALVAGASGATGGYFDLGVTGSALLGAGTTEAMIAVGDYDAEQEKLMRAAGYGSALVTAAMNYGSGDTGLLRKQRNPNRGFQQGKYAREAQAQRYESQGRRAGEEINRQFAARATVEDSLFQEQRDIDLAAGGFRKVGG